MKQIIYLITLFLFCACSGDDSKSISNTAPITPELITPQNNLLCIDNQLQFEWNTSEDLDGDAISYFIEIAKDNEFSQIVKSGTVTQTNKTYELEKGTAYYWRVTAMDSEGNKSSNSTIWNFYTEGISKTNHAPFLPALVQPNMNATMNTAEVTLQWEGSDVDKDNLTYDVFLGETTNMPKIQSNSSDNNLTVAINSNTTYYWRIDTIDSEGAKTFGKTWEFHSK